MTGFLRVTPDAGVAAYQKAGDLTSAATGSETGAGFGATLQRALGDAVTLGHEADERATEAVTGTGDLTGVVTAVSKAQLALQEVVAIRDKVVSAYQDVMRMTI